jgi:FAD/FMN-containing dehydrogenase
MTARYDIDALIKALGPIKTETNTRLVQQKSRDFYWYSPVLKRQLDHVTADIIVSPKSEAEVIATLKAAYALGIPVTPRGTGTGNYGQAMPLSGGIVLDLSGLNAITRIDTRFGSITSGAGALVHDLDVAAKKHGFECRLHPSTAKTATIGGFIAGGSGGVGSISWGGLRDLGNVIRVRAVTMEAEPRILEFTGEDIHKISHAYGVNGIITEVEMPLAHAHDWVDVLIGFADFDQAAAFANALGEQDGILKKQLAAIASPIPQTYFLRHQKFISEGQSIVVAMIAPFAMPALEAFIRANKGASLLMRSDRLSDEEKKGLPEAYELSWNHTTLRALRVDPAITYLQVLYPFPTQLETIARVHAHFGDEVMGHLEWVRFNGKVTAFGLPLVRFTTEERLEEIMRLHEEMGAPIFNPHRYTLEEGGMKTVDPLQLAFKKEADPKGLLNPGKMIAWDDPDFDFAKGESYLFPGLLAAE